jgi:hypothetical protein
VNQTMKSMVLASVLSAVVAAPAGGAPRERTQSVTYERASGIHLMDVAWVEVAAGELPEARPLAREKKVSVSITDDSGRPVGAVVHQGEHELGRVCGQSDAPLQLASREPVHVHVYSGPGCDDLSAPTTGTIEFTFTR